MFDKFQGEPKLHVTLDQRSKELEVDDRYDPSHESGVFTATLICPRDDCQEPVSVCGRAKGCRADSERGEEWTYALQPRFFCPSLAIIALSSRYPHELQAELNAAFAVYWCDVNACLNHIRNAIELLLTNIGVARKRFDSAKRKWLRLELSSRIDKLPPRYRGLRDALHALRWLGNAGSHPGVVTRDDALDGFELLDHVLEQRFDPRDLRIRQITVGVRRRKGPRRR